MTDDLPFFLDRYSAEMPVRIHSRDIDDGGAPQFAHAFTAYTDDGWDGDWARSKASELISCHHPTAGCPMPCPEIHVHLPIQHRSDCRAGCLAWHCADCEDTGYRERHNERWRHPAKRALSQLARNPVPKGRPSLDVVLRCLADNDGNAGLTISALSSVYSYMWQPVKASRWISHALWEFRAAYKEDAPARVLRDKSESQQIAEAAA